jgi:glycosyltransferase involved in cell wall biosynthesis
MGLTAIVPAYNEEQHVGAVVEALRASALFDDVIVIDDGSTDNTVEQAERAGGNVYRMPQNGGKGQAMLAGIGLCAGDVAFFDADLTGFTPAHAATMVAVYERGYDQVCAMRDYAPLYCAWELSMWQPITGERIVRRWILDLLPESCWRGYNIETAMNYVCETHGGRTCVYIAPGVMQTHKAAKRGWFKGHMQNARMYVTMWRTRRMLELTGGQQCERP